MPLPPVESHHAATASSRHCQRSPLLPPTPGLSKLMMLPSTAVSVAVQQPSPLPPPEVQCLCRVSSRITLPPPSPLLSPPPPPLQADDASVCVSGSGRAVLASNAAAVRRVGHHTRPQEALSLPPAHEAADDAVDAHVVAMLEPHHFCPPVEAHHFCHRHRHCRRCQLSKRICFRRRQSRGLLDFNTGAGAVCRVASH